MVAYDDPRLPFKLVKPAHSPQLGVYTEDVGVMMSRHLKPYGVSCWGVKGEMSFFSELAGEALRVVLVKTERLDEIRPDSTDSLFAGWWFPLTVLDGVVVHGRVSKMIKRKEGVEYVEIWTDPIPECVCPVCDVVRRIEDEEAP